MKLFNTKVIVRCAAVGALYFVLSLLTLPVASGAIQFRISEGLTLLPLLFPESAIGLFVGCFLCNLISGLPFAEVVFGSLITLLAGGFTLIFRYLKLNMPLKIVVGGLFPVLFNAFLLPLVWIYCYGALQNAYIIGVLFLVISQTVAVYAVGSLLIIGINKLKRKGIAFFN